MLALKNRVHTNGFTLIEMLTVIGIMGLLMTITLAAIDQARMNNRDAQRVADLRQLELAFEVYYKEFGSLPNCSKGFFIDGGNTGIDTSSGTCVDGAALNTFLESYFNSSNNIPHDPLGPGAVGYFYYYDGAHICNDPNSGLTSARMLFATDLEGGDTNVAQGLPSDACADQAGADGDFNAGDPYAIILDRY